MVFLLLIFAFNTVSFAAGPAQPTDYAQCIAQPKQPQNIMEMACRFDMEAHSCDEFFEQHPEATSKRRNCAEETAPGFVAGAETIAEYAGGCIKGFGENLADIVVAPVKFLFSGSNLPPDIIARERYFNSYDIVFDEDAQMQVERPKSQERIIQEKYQMLGPYRAWFTKTAIEGHGDKDPKIDCRDIVHQHYCYGDSTATLYHQVIRRLKREIKPGQQLDQPWVIPWTGKEFDTKTLHSRSLREWMNDMLEEFGVRQACYNSFALSELRCYAFFMVVNPLAAVSLAGKIAKTSGVTKPVAQISVLNKARLERYKHPNESLPSGRAKFERDLQFAEKKLKYVTEKGNGAEVFHGSSSSSLLMFSQYKDLGGLRPTGAMIKAENPPFSGELAAGLSQIGEAGGVNLANISAVKITDLSVAATVYTKKSSRPWSPETSKRYVANAKKRIEDSEELIFERNKIAIEEQRQKTWATMSAPQKKLVEDGYPVLYGLRPRDSRNLSVHKADGWVEVALEGGVDFDEIRVIFVPQNRIKQTKEILRQNNIQNINVEAIEPIMEALATRKAGQ